MSAMAARGIPKFEAGPQKSVAHDCQLLNLIEGSFFHSCEKTCDQCWRERLCLALESTSPVIGVAGQHTC